MMKTKNKYDFISQEQILSTECNEEAGVFAHNHLLYLSSTFNNFMCLLVHIVIYGYCCMRK